MGADILHYFKRNGKLLKRKMKSSSMMGISKISVVLVLFFMLAGLAIVSFPASAGDISGCTEITSAGVYTLTADITDATLGKCINITVSDVILDCQGHTVDGNDVAGTTGVYTIDTNNVTVTNCVVTDFETGITIQSGNNNNVTNSIVSSCLTSGIRMAWADFSLVQNNSAQNTTYN